MFKDIHELMNFKKIVQKLKTAGASRVGLTGSKIQGESKKDDTDILTIWPAGHKKETMQVAISERFMPDGSGIPKGIDVISVSGVEQGAGGDPVGSSAKKKARWLRFPNSS